MIGFLQGFYEDDILIQTDEMMVVQYASIKAIEIAMLGLAEEANAILITTRTTAATNRALHPFLTPRIEIFWVESGLGNPENVDSQALLELDKRALDSLPHLPEDISFDDITEESYVILSKFAKDLEGENATTGASVRDGLPLDVLRCLRLKAMTLSSALVGLLHMAKALGHDDEIPTLMKQIAGRIHSNQQSEYLALVRFVWIDFLLSGWLRQELELSLDTLKEYAQFILQTTKTRLERGPLRLDNMYSDFSMHQLLEELDHNTITDPAFRDEMAGGYLEEGDDKIESILRKPATRRQIADAEARIGRPLPEDIKDLMRITNGCLRVKVSPVTIFRTRLPPLDDIFLEEEDYMNDYTFTLLPDVGLGIEVDWPSIEYGGIAIYEHDGQGTEYVWILTETLIEKAKQRLQDAFDKANEQQKTAMLDAIDLVYGSREAFDDMKSCLYLQIWGEPSGNIVWPSFRSYLNWVVFTSRDMKERSPLTIPPDI